jgi:ketosteroid isomerase-like protein
MRLIVKCFRMLPVLLSLLAVAPSGAAASTADDVLALYRTFAAAQNRRDLPAVRQTLWNSPQFLWVSDGMAVWGPDALIKRMQQFQQSEVWKVEPELDKAVPVPLAEGSVMLHVPLTLVIGSTAPGPDRLRFLVEVICLNTAEGWRIAALLTTTEKRQN